MPARPSRLSQTTAPQGSASEIKQVLLHSASGRAWIPIGAAAFGLLLLYFAFRSLGEEGVSERWAQVDMAIGVATLCVAIVVWFGEARERWRESLPNRLTVEFYYGAGTEPVLVCRNATLASPGDIRAWSQQIGRQLLGGKDLDFNLHYEVSPALLSKDLRTEEFVNHYRSRFYLKSLPKDLVELRDQHGEDAVLEFVQHGAKLSRSIRKTP